MIPGSSILTEGFGLVRVDFLFPGWQIDLRFSQSQKSDLKAWDQFGIMFGWIFLMRAIHFFMVFFNNRNIGSSIGGPSKSSAQPGIRAKDNIELEMVVSHGQPAPLTVLNV